MKNNFVSCSWCESQQFCLLNSKIWKLDILIYVVKRHANVKILVAWSSCKFFPSTKIEQVHRVSSKVPSTDPRSGKLALDNLDYEKSENFCVKFVSSAYFFYKTWSITNNLYFMVQSKVLGKKWKLADQFYCVVVFIPPWPFCDSSLI